LYLKKKLPALRRELIIRHRGVLKTLNQEAKHKQKETEEQKPEGSDGECGENTELAEQTEQSENDSNPEGNFFG
jgi:hypothetical protein